MKSPSFQFYPADYLADAKVQALSIEGEGCYIRLMSYCWREGSIPSDRVAIAKLCKGYDGPGIDEALSLFVRGEKRGTLVHKRIDKERKLQQERSKFLSERGLSGALKRWHKDGVAINRPMLKNGSSSSSSTSVVEDPPTPRKRGRKYIKTHLGDNSDPRYRDAHERNLKRFPELADAEGKRGDE